MGSLCGVRRAHAVGCPGCSRTARSRSFGSRRGLGPHLAGRGGRTLRRGRDRPRRTSGVRGGSGARPGNDGRTSANSRPSRTGGPRRARPDPPTTGRPCTGPPAGATDSGGGAGDRRGGVAGREPGARHGADGACRRVEEPVTARMAPVVDAEEPVTAPVILATAAVGSVTLGPARPGAVTVAEPADDEQLLTAPTVLTEPEQATVAAKAARVHPCRMVLRLHMGPQHRCDRDPVRGLAAVGHGHRSTPGPEPAQVGIRGRPAGSTTYPRRLPAGPSLIPATTRVPPSADGSVVAELQIPAIGVDQYVVEGTSSTNLSKGPGHYVGTAAPGQAGNVAIAGHRTTHGAPFNRLGELRRGDRIILTSTSGQHLTYVVSGSPQAVSPSDVGVLNYFGDNRITLTTCTPEFSAAQRLIAVGELTQSVRQAPASSEARHLPPRRHGHRQLGVVVAPGGGDRGLPPRAPRDVLPAIRLLVRACRPVVHPRPTVGCRPLSAVRHPDQIPSGLHLTRTGHRRHQTPPAGVEASAPRSELSPGPVS